LKLVTITPLIDAGGFSRKGVGRRVLSDVRAAIDAVRWPPGTSNFTIHPQSGKKRGEGNGVKPIKKAFVLKLIELGWKPEQRYPRKEKERAILLPGAFDAWLDLTGEERAPFVVEWETGNVSSSHRAVNKMAMALQGGHISGGILVLPTRALAKFLTDRIGNYEELVAYFPYWSASPVTSGYLGILAVEHDATSTDVERIKKGTDGRALI
jgi:hypothetical protein